MDRFFRIGWSSISSGDRRSIYTAILALALLATGCTSLHLGRPIRTTPNGWTTEGGSPQRRQFVDETVSFPLEQVWRYEANAGFGPGSPLIAQETVFVSTQNGEVHALSLSTGNRRGSEEFGEAVEGTPVVTDSILYIPVAWEKPGVIAYDFVSGRVKWERRGVPIEAGLALFHELLYAVDVEGRVIAFNRATGDTTWMVRSDSLVTYLAAPVLAGDRLIVVDDRGFVRALDARTGELLWSRMLGTPVEHTPAVLDSTVFIPSIRGTLWALDVRTGQVEWTYRTKERPRRLTMPAVSHERLIVAATDGIVRSLDPATGHLQWKVKTGGPIVAAPLLMRNAVIVGSLDRNVYALDPSDGRVRWKTTVSGRISSAPAFKDEYLIILAEPYNVYAFAPQPDSSRAVSHRGSTR